MASLEASFMLICCTAASAPPGARPVRTRMSPMWLTSKIPTPLRTALCSATSPPLPGYSTGMSHPPKLTILARWPRCTAFRAVLRNSDVREVVMESILCTQAESDTNTRLQPGSKKRQMRGWRGLMPGRRSGTVCWEAFMPGPVMCDQCGKTEEYCACEKYCTICKGQHAVRLCADGLYYCPE